MQSWGAIPDLPAPILSLSHSPQCFITILSPVNGPQHFLPNQKNPYCPHSSWFMPNLGALLSSAGSSKEQTPQLASVSPSGDVSSALLSWVPWLMQPWQRQGVRPTSLMQENRCCGLSLVAFDQPREGKGAKLTQILVSKALHNPIQPPALPPSTPHHWVKQTSAHILGQRSRRMIICRAPNALLAAGKS